MHVIYVNDTFFYNRIPNFKILWNHVHGAGRQVELGQGEVHHVGGGVVQNTLITWL